MFDCYEQKNIIFVSAYIRSPRIVSFQELVVLVDEGERFVKNEENVQVPVCVYGRAATFVGRV